MYFRQTNSYFGNLFKGLYKHLVINIHFYKIIAKVKNKVNSKTCKSR